MSDRRPSRVQSIPVSGTTAREGPEAIRYKVHYIDDSGDLIRAEVYSEPSNLEPDEDEEEEVSVVFDIITYVTVRTIKVSETKEKDGDNEAEKATEGGDNQPGDSGDKVEPSSVDRQYGPLVNNPIEGEWNHWSKDRVCRLNRDGRPFCGCSRNPSVHNQVLPRPEALRQEDHHC